MRISSRFGLWTSLAVLPLLGVVGYCIDGLESGALTNQRLGDRHCVERQVASGIVSRLGHVQDYQRKYVISRDEGYAQKTEETLLAVDRELETLRAARLSPDESAAVDRFEVQLSRVMAELGALSAGGYLEDPSSADAWKEEIASQLDELVSLAVVIQQEAQGAAQVQAAAALHTSVQTRKTAVVVALGCVALCAALILLTMRSLRRRLDQFVRGTQAVSEGSFSFQLDTTADDELGKMARSFNRMVGALDQLERMKADFISSVSHELRTPLVAMLETNNLLLDGVPGPLTPKQRQMVALNTQAAQRLSKMIGDLLDLSRLKDGLRYDMIDTDIASLTRAAVGELEAMAIDRGIDLLVHVQDSPLVVRCDPDRYVQVVQSLLENALKYTPSGGIVEVGLKKRNGLALPSAEAALLYVEDSGPGIPTADRERVFEKFFRRGGVPSDGSVGLGLAICREIVKAHGGNVWVDRAAQLGGARLSVALPGGPAAEAS